MLRAFGHRVAMCCDILGVVSSSLKMVKYLSQQHPTCRNRVAKRTQHAAPNNVAICCDRLAGALDCTWEMNFALWLKMTISDQLVYFTFITNILVNLWDSCEPAIAMKTVRLFVSCFTRKQVASSQESQPLSL